MRDYIGQLVLSQKLEQNKINHIDNLPLANGLYTINILNKAKLLSSTKFIINK